MSPEPELVVAPATADDAPALHAMIGALADFEKLAHLRTGSVEALREALGARPPHAEALIARLGAEPVGFALFFHTFSTFLARRGLWLEDLFVLPEARGRGVGKALLRAVAGVAAARGCGRVVDGRVEGLHAFHRHGAFAMPAVCGVGEPLCLPAPVREQARESFEERGGHRDCLP